MRFGGIAATVRLWSDDSLMVEVPPAVKPGSVDVLVTIAGVKEEHPGRFKVLEANHLSPNEGSAGTLVTISGSGFGATQGTSRIFFGSIPVRGIRRWSDAFIAFDAPDPGTTPGSLLEVTLRKAGVVKREGAFTLTAASPKSGETAAAPEAAPATRASADPPSSAPNTRHPNHAAQSAAASQSASVISKAQQGPADAVAADDPPLPDPPQQSAPLLPVEAAEPPAQPSALQGGQISQSAQEPKENAIAAPPPAPHSKKAKRYDGVCQYGFNDCDYIWTLLGGLEQADLSSQSSQTEGFIDLFVRAPWNMRWGSIWLRSRFLGAPAATNTLNVATAATNASGFTTAQLPQNVFAVDYNIGFEHDFLLPDAKNKESAMFTWGPIVEFGATTPLDASTPTLAYSVPNYGTNECDQLHARFGAPFTINAPPGSSPPDITTPVTLTGNGNKYGYNPPLPPPGYYNTATSGAPTASTSPGCVVQPTPGTTVASIGQPGTQITTIAFSHEDRTSFLIKWQGGVRLINRFHSGTSSVCSTWSNTSAGHENDGRCSRLIADITIGQDESITGGYLRHFVMKNDILLPISTSGLYFFGAASTRFSRNQTFSPLILNSLPIASGANPPSGAVTIPSPSVFVLPLKQPDRDYYRIGFGIDITTLIKPLVSK